MKKSMISHFIFIFILYSAACTAFAKDLYVSTTGDDSVAYADNDINKPWATPQKAWLNALAGDVVYFRAGTYNVTTPINTQTGHSGTVLDPIKFTTYNNENVTIAGNCSGSSIFFIETSNIQVDGMTFTGSNFNAEGAIFFIGYNRTAENFKISNSVLKITQSNSGDNVAAIRLQATRANNAIIENNIISNINTVQGVQIFRTQGVKIRNNVINGAYSAIHYKHSNTLADTGIEIINNHIYNARIGIHTVSNYARIVNNLIIGSNIYMGDDGGVGDGWVGCDFNTIRHNTIVGGTINMYYQNRPEDPNKGCINNIIKDNILTIKSEWHPYSDIVAGTQSDNNLYPATGAIVYKNRVNYTLADWAAANNSDANSKVGTPVFVGDQIPYLKSNFELSPGSIGTNAASDGKNIGADISMVGQNGYRLQPSPPSQPQ